MKLTLASTLQMKFYRGAQTMNKKLLAVLALSATLIVDCSNVAKTDRI